MCKKNKINKLFDMAEIFENISAYLHVPFCAKPCGYCRFYKKIPTSEDISFYIDTLQREVNDFQTNYNFERKFDTFFWGGGTPSILNEQQTESLAKIFTPFLPTQEWTVEVSPSTITQEKLKLYKDLGVSRISLGVQSFSDTTLKRLGRAHSLENTLKAIDLIGESNFQHFSLDLIFGASGQTQDDFRKDIECAVATPVDHISAYCLEFESGTSSCAGLKTEIELKKNSDDADLFLTTMHTLKEFGFTQYEISNYARFPNAQCLHNLSTWNMAQWIGFGPAAASQFAGKRFRNTPMLKAWAEGIKCGKPKYEDIVILDDEEMFSSALIFGLRMNNGVDFTQLQKRFPSANSEQYINKLEMIAEENLLIFKNNKVALTEEGRLYADSIAVELLP